MNPKYKCGDNVSFILENQTITGSIAIVDDDGTWENSGTPSYDIVGELEGNEILFKHINESLINEKVS